MWEWSTAEDQASPLPTTTAAQVTRSACLQRGAAAAAAVGSNLTATAAALVATTEHGAKA